MKSSFHLLSKKLFQVQGKKMLSKKYNKLFLGIGKTKYNSSACLLDEELNTTTIWLTERLNRKKSSGEWPHKALINAEKIIEDKKVERADNRDFSTPEEFENFYDQKFPFYEFLENNKLKDNVKKFNPNLKSAHHHEAHAYAALAMSPFEKSILIVWDGAGSATHLEDHYEEYTVYLQNFGLLEQVESRSAKYIKSTNISESLGLFYETISKFIFNNQTSAGKVMGLAPFGKPLPIINRVDFQENLDWKKAFQGNNKSDWESSDHYEYYCDLAATAQMELEKEFSTLLLNLKNKYVEYENLIIAGGCALNCTNNAKILNSHLFKKIYIPPFPGDDGIGFGLAHLLRLKNSPEKWHALPPQNQISYLGPIDSLLSSEEVILKLSDSKINYSECVDLVKSATLDIVNGCIVGWFQGRSECGPRALGNRSILARPDIAGLKSFLNDHLKFRENFRPYGCSTLFEYANNYFEIPIAFDNPFMSFAIQTKKNYLEKLKEVTHIDGTSRMQTVRIEQNELFYNLIKSVGDINNLYCLLNTSLNIMGQPIVESVDDAINFFLNSKIKVMYIGNFRLSR
jgi:carbamoyltransferase